MSPIRVRRRRARRARPGLTLVEVVVALALAGLVLLGARGVLESVADAADAVARGAALADGEANADRFVRGLFERLEVGVDEAHRFVGREHALRFASWCAVPAGWQEPCTVTVAVDSLRGVLALSLSTGEQVVLRRGFAHGALRYLGSAGGGGVWLAGWGAGITAPPAIAVVVDGDTLVLRIGERG